MNPPTTPTRAERLAAVHAASRALRCEAFVDYAPTVAGIRLRPITITSYNLLVATRNGFVTGAGVGVLDIINFVWVHHPAFGQFAHADKRRVSRAAYAAVCPAFPAINALVRVAMTVPRFRWLRWFARPTAEERVEPITREIVRLLTEARGDFPTGDDGGEPAPFANQAHLLNLFRRELGMTFAETSALPMKQVAQHYRELIHHATAGKAVLMTPAEAEIWREHLQAPAPAQRDAAA